MPKSTSKTYIVAAVKEWHKIIFDKEFKKKSNWIYLDKKEKLTLKNLQSIKPRYIFFPHWSWIVSDEILNNFECVCFHSSDVPFGRGGSPIQNLIIRGHQKTKISALKMVKELDAGPVYLKKNLSLKGRAQKIFEDSSLIIAKMMKEIALREPQPIEQKGKASVFKRRKDKDNLLPINSEIEQIYNHIRMLDAESYPQSYLELGKIRLDFSHAQFKNNEIQAKVKIKKIS